MRTEEQHPATSRLDQMSPAEIIELMSREDAKAVEAVAFAAASIAKAVEAVANAYKNGGKVIYVGAGTSGRMAAADVAEMRPTFGVEPGRFIAVVAGNAFMEPSAAVEDDRVQARRDLLAALTDNATPMPGLAAVRLPGEIPATTHIVIGVSASGRTPYTVEALSYAKARGLSTVGIANNPGTPLLSVADIPILLDTGPEVIAGMTRLKAGTAQKMALNMISVGAMVLCGRVKSNLMTHLTPMSEKLRLRAVRIVMAQLGLSEEAARKRLEEANWSLQAALE